MIPTATYRLQFRNGMTFDRAAALVPYLTHLYRHQSVNAWL